MSDIADEGAMQAALDDDLDGKRNILLVNYSMMKRRNKTLKEFEETTKSLWEIPILIKSIIQDYDNSLLSVSERRERLNKLLEVENE